MKKLLILLSSLLLVASCDWFVFDNQEGYNAQISGKFIDSETGELVPMGFPNVSSISVIEEGWDAEETQTWYVKPNGTYTNNLVFAGNYRIQTSDSNFYPLTEQFTINRGANTVDFTVTPYARIIDPEITYDSANSRIVAKFKVSLGDATKANSVKVFLLGYTDRFVSDGFNNFTDASAKLEAGVVADGQTEYTLYVDVTSTTNNNSQFKYKRTHYVRIGALATGIDWTTWTFHNSANKYNFSPVFSISKDFSTITEITDWVEE